jgi:transposase
MAAQRNKTDATDALGIAHIVRTGWFRQAHPLVRTSLSSRLVHRRVRELSLFSCPNV